MNGAGVTITTTVQNDNPSGNPHQTGAGMSPAAAVVEGHWREMRSRKRLYTWGGSGVILIALMASLWFANETNSGKFFERLPYIFDFLTDLKPRDWLEPFRALFDLASPYDDGSLKFNYPVDRVYITRNALYP